MSLGLIHRHRVHPWAMLRDAERTLARPQAVRPASAPRPFDPRLEAHETENGWEVSAELPGVARDDLEVFVQEGVLTIRGARRFGRREAPAIDTTTTEAAADEANAEATPVPEADDANTLRFERRIRFNGDVDEDAVSARYTDGLLEVIVPRVVPSEPEVRTIPIELA